MRITVLATFPAALPVALLAGRAPVWLIAVSMFAAGVASDVCGVLWVSTMQREVPEKVLSRVSSYDWLGSLALAPAALLAAGPLAAAVGVTPVLAACAAVIVLATATALGSPQVRMLERAGCDGSVEHDAAASFIAD
ncbi:MAG TPA: hypothetical protein VH637_07765 [Streptosporangiaceae bacterium]